MCRGLNIPRQKAKCGGFGSASDRRRAHTDWFCGIGGPSCCIQTATAVLAETKSVRILTTAATAPHPSRGTRGGVGSQVLRASLGSRRWWQLGGHPYLPPLAGGAAGSDAVKYSGMTDGRIAHPPRYQRGRGLRISRTRSMVTHWETPMPSTSSARRCPVPSVQALKAMARHETAIPRTANAEA